MRIHPKPFLLLAALALAAQVAPCARAARYGDVDVSPIAGETARTEHGYAPYRFRIRNDSPAPVRVGLALGARASDGINQLRREVEVPARAGVEVVLHQPAEAFYPNLCEVSVNGRRQEDPLSVGSLQHGEKNYGSDPKCFMLTSNRLDTGERDGLTEEPSSGSSNNRLANATAAMPVAEWPSDWLSFSRWDAVAVTHDEFEAMPAQVRAGLTDWVRAGGNLLVLRAGKEEMPQEWKGLSVDGPNGCAARGIGLGRVVFVPRGAEREAGHFAWLRAKEGDGPAVKTPECAPVASGQVAVRGMFLLMLVFAVVVGPVNYVFCARGNRRIWMLWTSPVIAGLFIAAVFAYALFSDGIRPWGRSAVVTLLDEKTHSAVTLGTTAWYAPMLPSEGLRFRSAAEVRTVSKPGGVPWEDRRTGLGVAQGAAQQLTGGWMVPRYPESFAYRRVEDSRLRMKFEKDANGDVWAVNGLGVEAAELRVVAGARRLHCGRVPLDAKVKLEPGDGPPGDARLLPRPHGDYWAVRLASPLFAEVPLDGARSHEVSETVIGRMEEPLP